MGEHRGVRTHYLSGPMRGLPQYNVPAFRRVAALLRKQGYSIISPAELDSDAVRAVSERSLHGNECDRDGRIGGETAGEILARDVRILHDEAQGIIFLPGWERSRGARLEAFVALLQRDFEFKRWDDHVEAAFPVSRRTIECKIHAAWEHRI